MEGQQNSIIGSQLNSSLQSQQQFQLEDLPEKKQPPFFEARWVNDASGGKMVFKAVDPRIPKEVYHLPAPPSDCGSAFQSDSSLTASLYTTDPNHRSQTYDENDESTHSQIINSDPEDEDEEADTIHYNEEVLKLLQDSNVVKTMASVGSGKKSNGSTATKTASLSEDLESQRYPRRIFQQRKLAGKDNDNNGKLSQKKKVTLVEPARSWTEEREELREKIQKTQRREIFCRRAVFALFFLSFLSLVVGGGLYAMTYFDIIDLNNLNIGDWLNGKSTTVTTDLEDILYETPLATSSPSLDTVDPTPAPSPSPSRSVPTASPTVSVEGTFIIDTLSGQFRIQLPPNDPSAPQNRAVDWMAKELKSIGKGHFDYQYDNLGKFGQRFAILTTQFSLLGEDVVMDSPPFAFDEQMGVDECNWEGVGCDSYGRVIGLDFSDLDLTGRIPPEIRYLFKLETLDLCHQRITGTIPKEIYELRNLKKLYLYQNELTGTISTLIGQLDSLEYLHLAQNSLTGSIPEQLRSYSYSVLNPMIYLNLYDNRMTGTIPNNLNLGNLFYFDIGRNNIGGTIPKDIGTDYGELKYLHIDHNRLTGNIPDTIPLIANGRMMSFLANHNRLSGTVPDNWVMFNKLVQYNIKENGFISLGPANCNMNVFSGGQCVEFKADCDICSCNDNFCEAMCSTN